MQKNVRTHIIEVKLRTVKTNVTRVMKQFFII